MDQYLNPDCVEYYASSAGLYITERIKEKTNTLGLFVISKDDPGVLFRFMEISPNILCPSLDETCNNFQVLREIVRQETNNADIIAAFLSVPADDHSAHVYGTLMNGSQTRFWVDENANHGYFDVNEFTCEDALHCRYTLYLTKFVLG